MEEKIRILYAEDDPVIAELNRDMLERTGYAVDVAYNGEEAWEKYQHTDYHLLLLDIIMPGKSGFELLHAVRAKNTAIPIVIYSSITESDAVAKALDMGADEYIRKECEPPEVLARLKVIVRHFKGLPIYILSGITLFSYSGYLLQVGESAIQLTPAEAKLLRYLSENRNTVVSKLLLCEKLWGISTPGKVRTIDNYMVKLRKYLKPDKSLQIITSYGEGYALMREADK